MHLSFNCPIHGRIERHFVESDDYLIDSDTTGRVEVGCVIAASTIRDGKQAYVLAKKSPKPGYIYSGMWVLPGGMTRIRQSTVDSDILAIRAVERLQSEVNLSVPSQALSPIHEVPPVTEYRIEATGKDCVVMVLAFALPTIPDLLATARPSHHSVDAVRVADPLPLLHTVAPANRVILARLLWSQLTDFEQNSIKDTVREALDGGNTIAMRVGFQIIHPWF